MTDKEKLDIARDCFQNVVWMAVRYAHGRQTYAPSMVRDAVEDFKAVFPDFELREDHTVQPPESMGGVALESDYLHDLVNPLKRNL